MELKNYLVLHFTYKLELEKDEKNFEEALLALSSDDYRSVRMRQSDVGYTKHNLSNNLKSINRLLKEGGVVVPEMVHIIGNVYAKLIIKDGEVADVERVILDEPVK